MAEIVKIQLTPEVALVAHSSNTDSVRFQLDFVAVDPQGRRHEHHAPSLTAEEARLIWDMFKVKTADDKVKADEDKAKAARRASTDIS